MSAGGLTRLEIEKVVCKINAGLWTGKSQSQSNVRRRSLRRETEKNGAPLISPATNDAHGNDNYALRSRRMSAESRKKPMPTAKGMMPKAAAIQASCSMRAITAKVAM